MTSEKATTTKSKGFDRVRKVNFSNGIHSFPKTLIRPLWIVITTLALALFAAGIPDRFNELLQGGLANERILLDFHVSPGIYAGYFIALDMLLVLVHVALAGVIFWRGSDNPVAILVSLALVTSPLAVTGALETGNNLGHVIADIILYLGLVSSITLLYLFPDGRFVPGWTRFLALSWALINVPVIFRSEFVGAFAAGPLWLQPVLIMAWPATGVYAQIYRYRKESDFVQRRQATWAILGLAAAALAPVGYYLGLLRLPSVSQAAPSSLFYNLADPVVFQFAILVQVIGLTLYTLILLIFPVSFAVAIFRYRLFELNLVLNRTLVYGGLTALVIGLYVVIVGLLSILLQSQINLFSAALATGVIALLVHPLRERLQEAVNRLMYGERYDPVAVLIKLGDRLENSADPEAIFTTIVKAIRPALKVPYTAIAIKQGDGLVIMAEDGEAFKSSSEKKPHPILNPYPWSDEGSILPLSYRSEVIGQIIVAPRDAGSEFSTAEVDLLKSIAHQAGPAVYAAKLTEDLQRSRERLVTAREEERRRLRRDLHDGLGPRLATIMLKLDTARNLISKDTLAAEAELLELKDQTRTTIADIRRLVNELRPAALDQLGLVTALNEYASGQSRLTGVKIIVDTPWEMPSLPAAVEVAAYLISLEAINNVIRHAQATFCHLTVTVTDELRLEIVDDGRGISVNSATGMGLTSMRERAMELGGDFQVEQSATGGTMVSAILPLSLE